MEIKYSYENNGETFMRLKVGGQYYTIRGYSRAGLKTCILIDEFNVAFDMGYSNDRAFSYDNKLISHGHNDHIGSLHNDHCARKLFNIHKEKLYIMPKQCIKPFKLIASAFSELNCGRSGDNIKIFDHLLLTNIIPSEDCTQEYTPLINTTEYVVRSFLVDHKIKSYGYIIYRKSKKLKPEYQNKTSKEIVQIKNELKGKMAIHEISEMLVDVCYTPLIGYTGDTTINGVIENDEFLRVPLLLMECTGFNEIDLTDTIDGKHIHLNNLIENADLFKNDKIILFHFSQQYKKYEDISEYTKSLPETIKTKLIYFF